MANYLTGAVRYKDGVLDELVVFCTDPLSPELEAVGYMEQDFIATAQGVIEDIKAGDKFFASFRGADKLYPVEIVSRDDGKETLEVVQQGQPEAYASLRRLPAPGTAESDAWAQKFYEEFMRLSQGSVGTLHAAHLAHDMYVEHGNRDPVEAAREIYDATT